MNETLLIKVGKALDNDVILNLPFISEYHLELFQDAERNVFMTDLNSSNGTFVNGKRLIGYIQLFPKDDVFLGSGFKLQWEQLLQANLKKNNNTEPQPNKQKEKVRYENAFESQKKESQEPNSNNKSFYQLNKDLFIIYGLVLLLACFWYFYLLA